MANQPLLPDNLRDDIKNTGTGAFVVWLSENNFSIPQSSNFYDSLEEMLEKKTIQLDDILKGISELEENSDKNIFLYQAKSFESLASNQKDILREIKKTYGFTISNDVTLRVKPGNGPTFVFMNIENQELKLKFSELHYDKEDDLANDRYIRVPKIVNIFLKVELETGFGQLRFDAPGQIHTHKNDLGKPSEIAYQNYYKDLFTKLFPTIPFEQFNLTGVANYIRLKEKDRFLMQKLANTVSEGVKQSYSMPRKNRDVRLIKELIGAAATDENNEWLTEDISGYWLATHSNEQLKKDLFMRIYRRDSEIRVQRGCLKKELDYGINQIREIQKAL